MSTLSLAIFGALALAGCHHHNPVADGGSPDNGDGMRPPGDGGVDDDGRLLNYDADHTPGPGSITMGTAVGVGVIGVIAIDGVTGSVIYGAQLAVDDQSLGPISGDGSTLVHHPMGSAVVTVTAPGYIDARYETAVSEVPATVTAVMLPDQEGVVGAAGGTLTQSGYTIVVPANAFPDNTNFLAWLLAASDEIQLGKRAQFLGNDNLVHQVIGGILYKFGATPASPLSITVPVPPHGTGTTLTGWSIDATGEWANPIAPTSQTATDVTFSVSMASASFGVTLDIDPSHTAFAASGSTSHHSAGDEPVGAIVIAVTNDATVTTAGSTTAATIGMKLAPGTTLASGHGMAIIDPRGDVIDLYHGTTATLNECLVTTPCISGGSDLSLGDGNLVVLGNAAAPAYGPPRVTLRSKTVVATDTYSPGSSLLSFQLDGEACSDVRTIDHVRAFLGTVNVTATPGTPLAATGALPTSITAPQYGRYCSNCKASQPQTCCTSYEPEAYAIVPETVRYQGELRVGGVDAPPGQPGGGSGRDICNGDPGSILGLVAGTTLRAVKRDGAENAFGGDTPLVEAFLENSCQGTGERSDDQISFDLSYQLVNNETMSVVLQISNAYGSFGSCSIEYFATSNGTNPYVDAGTGTNLDAGTSSADGPRPDAPP